MLSARLDPGGQGFIGTNILRYTLYDRAKK